jgi:hypothetical protein
MDGEYWGCLAFAIPICVAFGCALGLVLMFFKRKISIWTGKTTERRLFRKAAPKEPQPTLRPRLLPFKFPLLTLVALMLVAPGLSRRPFAFLIDLLSYLLIFLSIGVASYLHSRPNSIRHSQYNVLLCGIALFWFSAQLNTLHYFVNKLFLIAGAILACALLAGLQLVGSLWARHFAKAQSATPPRSLRISFFWLSVLTPYILILSVVVKTLLVDFGAEIILDFLSPFNLGFPLTYMLIEYFPPASASAVVLFRYFLGDQIARWPIIYLRSFKYKAGPTAFSQIVAGPTGRAGKVFALVHNLQTPSDLQETVSTEQQAQLFIVPDAEWESWMTSKLMCAYFVVCDFTVESPSLTWEMSEALRLLPQGKIVVIHGTESEPSLCAQLDCIRYTISKSGLTAAKNGFNKWLLGHVYSPDLPRRGLALPELSGQLPSDPESPRASLP